MGLARFWIGKNAGYSGAGFSLWVLVARRRSLSVTNPRTLKACATKPVVTLGTLAGATF